MKKMTIFLAFLLFVGFQAAAQMQITGTVTGAEDGLSIPGVSIVVKNNPTIGTTTDIDGKYSLTVPSDAEALVFSFVGMQTVEVPISGRSVIDVQMESEVLEMDEVIVVGYGTQRKEAKTGAVSTVSSESLKT
ncbi:MAG: carboxypeptidase-like regulatory domain-containing protein, partial [Bacteroidales bacterium]|nr:carboxypeptidase-like regulatory domain-containing protein [Bacteroidales bacterium]